MSAHDIVIVAERRTMRAGERDAEVAVCRTCCINTGKISQYMWLAGRPTLTPSEVHEIVAEHEAAPSPTTGGLLCN